MMLLVNSFAQEPEITNGINQIRGFNDLFAPYKVSLTVEQRRGLRIVGNSRVGLANMIAGIAEEYKKKLPSEESYEELTTRLTYLNLLKTYKRAVKNLLESLDDTEKALGKDIMLFVDKYSGILNNARKFDGDLDEDMKELDDYNARFGKVIDEEEEDEAKDPGTDLQTAQ